MEPEQLPLTWRDAAEAMIKGAENTKPHTEEFRKVTLTQSGPVVTHTCALGSIYHTWIPSQLPEHEHPHYLLSHEQRDAVNSLQGKYQAKFGPNAIADDNDMLGRDVIIERVKVLLEEDS